MSDAAMVVGRIAAEDQRLSVGLIDDADIDEGAISAVAGVEERDLFGDAAPTRIPDIGFDLIIVIGVVEEEVGPRDKAGPFMAIAAACGEAMRAEGARLIREVHARPGGDRRAYEIDGAPDGVRPVPNRHDAAVDIGALDHRDGDIGEAVGEAGISERDAVEEEANLLSFKAAEADAFGAAEPALAANGDSLGACDHLAEIGRPLVGCANIDDIDS